MHVCLFPAIVRRRTAGAAAGLALGALLALMWLVPTAARGGRGRRSACGGRCAACRPAPIWWWSRRTRARFRSACSAWTCPSPRGRARPASALEGQPFGAQAERYARDLLLEKQVQPRRLREGPSGPPPGGGVAGRDQRESHAGQGRAGVGGSVPHRDECPGRPGGRGAPGPGGEVRPVGPAGTRTALGVPQTLPSGLRVSEHARTGCRSPSRCPAPGGQHAREPVESRGAFPQTADPRRRGPARGLPPALSFRPGPVPGAGDPLGPERGIGPGGGPHRRREDADRRVRDLPGPGRPAPDHLHDPPQGPEQPEIQRLHPPVRRRPGGHPHRRREGQPRRPHPGHDHRDPAEPAVHRAAAGHRHGGPGRVPLPGRRGARHRLGRDRHQRAADDPTGGALGHGQQPARDRRLDRRGAPAHPSHRAHGAAGSRCSTSSATRTARSRRWTRRIARRLPTPRLRMRPRGPGRDRDAFRRHWERRRPASPNRVVPQLRERQLAPGHLLHLQPGGVRARTATLPGGRRLALAAGAARRGGRGDRQHAAGLPEHRGRDRGELAPLRRAAPRRGDAPRRDPAGPEALDGDPLRARTGQGGLRHRDHEPGHPHAGPERGDPRGPEAKRGRLPPAHA